ncbi:TIM barrel protein [Candidatus Poribacteria bacterium]|nr:TIM barrel protein [Candidatus Poribacteria bacterium]
MFNIGVVTDEISNNLEEAVEIAKSWGLEYIELHSVWGTNICDVDYATLSRVLKIIRFSGLTVTNIDSLTLRCSLDNDEEYSEHIEHLIRSIKIASLFDTNIVRLFSFWKEDDVDDKWDQIFEKMELAVKIAERENVILGFENVSSGNIGTSDELLRLFKYFDSPNLKLIWDPGNAYAAGEEKPFPDGYEKIKDKIIHIHIKDVVFDENGERIWKPVGQGAVNYEDHLEALYKDNYQGVVALETHCTTVDGSKIESTKESLDGINAIIKGIEENYLVVD